MEQRAGLPSKGFNVTAATSPPGAPPLAMETKAEVIAVTISPMR